MSSVTFEIPGEPVAKGRPRFARQGGFVKTFTPEKTANYETLVKLEYERQAQKHFGGAKIGVRIVACFGIPKSASKKMRMRMLDGSVRPMKKPDCDNVLKIVCDALNAIAYDDDKQIVHSEIDKLYSERPKVEVTIWEM